MTFDDSTDVPAPEQLRDLVDAGSDDAANALLGRLESAPVADRKAAMRALKPLAESTPAVVASVASSFAAFLTDDDRAVRLSTAKLFVALAEADPDAVVDCVPALADRLADDGEFYYVRARSAEALGYVAAAHPSVATPELVADLRIGLAFDEPEVKRKLAKALAHIALGNPRRLRHHVADLTAHLDSDDELVRYHLATTLVAVGCDAADALEPATTALSSLSADPNPYVRGRAAEALGLAAHDGLDVFVPDEWNVDAADADAADFLVPRVRFAVDGDSESVVDVDTEAVVDGVADPDAIAERTDRIVEAITTPDGSVCPQCGLPLPAGGPPMCPRCGRPH